MSRRLSQKPKALAIDLPFNSHRLSWSWSLVLTTRKLALVHVLSAMLTVFVAYLEVASRSMSPAMTGQGQQPYRLCLD